jgi:hypothetical protein
MRCLVQKLGANVNQATWSGLTSLMFAARSNDLAVVQCFVVEFGADVNLALQRDGRTPLIMAASAGHLAVVRCLVECGAEVGAVDTDGNTALLKSARFGQCGTTQYLLEGAGANIDDANNDGHTLWTILIVHLAQVAYGDEVEPDPLTLTGLLRVLVLRGALPPALVALLSPEPARVVQEGAQLRALISPSRGLPPPRSSGPRGLATHPNTLAISMPIPKNRKCLSSSTQHSGRKLFRVWAATKLLNSSSALIE